MHIVIIGSGIAGITFAEKIRSLQPDSRVTLLTKETEGYYSRPILSHGFSKQNIEQTIILKTFSQLQKNNIEIISGVEVTAIERKHQSVLIDNGKTWTYDKLILAQGSAAFVPPPLLPYRDLFFLLNNLADLKLLRRIRHELLRQQKLPNWAIIGGGLIGCEVASDLAVAGDDVTIFHAMDRLMERQLVAEDSETLAKVLRSAGLKILLNQNVQGLQKQGGKISVNVANQSESYIFDAVIVSCGFKPRIDLAIATGLHTQRGIKVNPFLQTNDERIYALGDVAELPNGKLYAFIMPIRSQALWLAGYLNGDENKPWLPPKFNPKAKVHGFEAANPYIF